MKKSTITTLRLALAVICGTAGLVLSSCSTANGFGQDVKTTGNAIQRAAHH